MAASINSSMVVDCTINHPVDTECKLNVHKTFKGRPGRLLNVLCTSNLHPVSMGQVKSTKINLFIDNLS